MPDKLPNHASNSISLSDSYIYVINLNFWPILSKKAKFLNYLNHTLFLELKHGSQILSKIMKCDRICEKGSYTHIQLEVCNLPYV